VQEICIFKGDDTSPVGTYTKRLTDYMCKFKSELQIRYHLDWFSKSEPSEQNPQIELNRLLHGVIRELIFLIDAMSE
jgi:hypothetical protein